MLNESLEYAYFQWLCLKIGADSTQKDDYTCLLDRMHLYEFVWTLPGDDNRAEDCYDLRRQFLREEFIRSDDKFLYERIHSVLEVLIAFSDRAGFETDAPLSVWFWVMIYNLKLDQYPDEVFTQETAEIVDDILYRFVWRLYDRKGDGGLFPLSKAKKDQRKVELWYQFFAYLEDTNAMPHI